MTDADDASKDIPEGSRGIRRNPPSRLPGESSEPEPSLTDTERDSSAEPGSSAQDAATGPKHAATAAGSEPGPAAEPELGAEPELEAEPDLAAEAEPVAVAAGSAPKRSRRKPKKDKREKSQGSFFKELPVLIVIALVLSFLLQTFIARVYMIPSQSMEPTLHGCPGCTGDRIVVEKLTYHLHGPHQGDVVVFHGPPSWNEGYQSIRSSNVVVRGLQNFGSLIGVVPPDENDLVKRVIATGGQTVECHNATGGLRVDGQLLNEPYIKDAATLSVKNDDHLPCFGAGSPAEFGPVKVPDGRLWVMGDNRINSSDSRFHMGDGEDGTVPVANVRGKAVFRIWPLGRIGTIPS